MARSVPIESDGDWITALRVYLIVMLVGNLVWEAAQLPLYTIWSEGSRAHLMLAMFHGTGGDVFIAASALAVSLALFGDRHWPHIRPWHVAVPTVLIGLGYTFYSEWMNVEVRHVWAYSDLMPRLPYIGTGLSPVMQWLVVPTIAFALMSRQQRLREDGEGNV